MATKLKDVLAEIEQALESLASAISGYTKCLADLEIISECSKDELEDYIANIGYIKKNIEEALKHNDPKLILSSVDYTLKEYENSLRMYIDKLVDIEIPDWLKDLWIKYIQDQIDIARQWITDIILEYFENTKLIINTT